MSHETVSHTLARGIIALSKSSDSARADAQLLLAHTLRRDRAWLVAHGDSFLSKAQAERFVKLCAQRATGVPVAYLVGSAWFCGRELNVNEHVLIPRPETELLVEEAVTFLRSQVDPSRPKVFLTALDVGTGSGAIACSIAAEVAQVFVEATDISAEALKVAEVNARRLTVNQRCKFYQGDLLEPIANRSFNLIVANLPYVPTADIAPSPDPVSFEPRIALDGGADGLDLYRGLLLQAPKRLKSSFMMLLEAAPPTIDELHALAASAFPRADVSVGVDYAAKSRFVRIVAV